MALCGRALFGVKPLLGNLQVRLTLPATDHPGISEWGRGRWSVFLLGSIGELNQLTQLFFDFLSLAFFHSSFSSMCNFQAGFFGPRPAYR
jgi:hypothetical protein